MPSPVLPSEICALKVSATSKVCDRIKNTLLSLPTKLCDLVSYLFNSSGLLSDSIINEIQTRITFDIHGLPSVDTIAPDDEFPLYDTSSASNRKTTLTSIFSAVAAGKLSSNTGATSTVLAAGVDTLVAEFTLSLPEGKQWNWIRIVFSTIIDAHVLGSIGNFKVKFGTDFVSLNNNFPSGATYGINNGDDSSQVSFIAEGDPSGHASDQSLVISLYAQARSGGGFSGDETTMRKCFCVAEYR